MQPNNAEVKSQVSYGIHLVDVHTTILIGVVTLEDIVTQYRVGNVYILIGRHSHILTPFVMSTTIKIGFYVHCAL